MNLFPVAYISFGLTSIDGTFVLIVHLCREGEVVDVAQGIWFAPERRRGIRLSWVWLASQGQVQTGMCRQTGANHVHWGWKRQKGQQEPRHVSVKYPGVCGELQAVWD